MASPARLAHNLRHMKGETRAPQSTSKKPQRGTLSATSLTAAHFPAHSAAIFVGEDESATAD